MIRWDLTESEFGYGESNARSYSKIVVQCDECSGLNHVGYGSHKSLLSKRGGIYRCQKCIKYSPEYRSKISKTMVGHWCNHNFRGQAVATRNTPEYLDNARQKAINLWKDSRYRAKIDQHNSLSATKNKRSAITRKLWDNIEYRAKALPDSARRAMISASVAKWWQQREIEIAKVVDPIVDSVIGPEIEPKLADPILVGFKISEAIKQKWNDRNYRNKTTAALVKNWTNPEYRQKVIDGLSRPDIKEKMAAIRAAQLVTTSSLQLQLYRYLDDLNVEYHPEGPETQIGYYVFDCLIPTIAGRNILIECQGDYWHSLDHAIANDRSKFTYIDRYFPEYEIMYVWEHEFMAKGRILDRIKSKLGIELQTIDFDFNDVVLRDCPSHDYKSFLDAYHYIGKGRGGQCFGAYIDNKLVACSVFSPPVRQNLSSKFGNFAELSRFCIHPLYHKKNFATWLLSRFLKMNGADKVVAYADTTIGHSGTIYKAANFQFSHEVPPDYWYVDNDGYVVRKKRLYEMAKKMSMTESEYANANNYIKKWGGKKLCFVYDC